MKKDIKKTKKGFDTVKFFRKVKTRLSKKLYGMTYDQLKAYLDAVPPVIPRKLE